MTAQISPWFQSVQMSNTPHYTIQSLSKVPKATHTFIPIAGIMHEEFAKFIKYFKI